MRRCVVTCDVIICQRVAVGQVIVGELLIIITAMFVAVQLFSRDQYCPT